MRKDREIIQFKKNSGRNCIVLEDPDKFKAVLYKSLYVPSSVHSYTLAIEFMKKWFEEKFDKNYFRYVHVNGKHMFDDYKRFNKQNVVRENPLYILTPTIEADHDRDGLDLYYAGPELWLKRSDFQRSFFKDYEDQVYLGMQMKELKMSFNFRVRLDTRAQQLDMKDRMDLMFRIGGTQTIYTRADFVIPKQILLDVAEKKHFPIVNGEIENPTLFLQYLNSHSEIPMLYQLRNINNKLEYYIRLPEIWCNIWTNEKLQIDDGETVGMLHDNFNIDLQCTLRMSVPHFFVYFCEKPVTSIIETVEHATIGLYTLAQFVIDPIDEHGWETYLNTTYKLDKDEVKFNIGELIKGTDIEKVIDDLLYKNISPECFINLKIYKEMGAEYPLVYSKIDYKTREVIIEPVDADYIYIVVYIDKFFFNQQILKLTEMKDNNRIEKKK